MFNRTLRGFIKKEFAQVLRDPRMRMLLFVAPMMQMTLFGVAISTDIKQVRLSAVMDPHDVVAQHVYEHAIGSGWFVPAKVTHSDPFEQINSREADAVLVAPAEGLTQSIQRNHGEVQLLVNASNVMKAQSVENYMKNVVNQVVPLAPGQATPKPPFEFDVRILYNPTMRTAVFMVPGVMSMLVCLLTILLTSMSISKEKETGTFEMLISAPVSSSEVILGKTIPYVILGLSNIPLILSVAVFVFDIPMKGPFLLLGLASFVFVCTTVALGTLISTLANNQQQSMMAGFLFLFPSIQLSGLMFPLENMPTIMKVFAYLNPLTHFLALIRNIMLKGGDLRMVGFHVGVLALMAVLIIWISFKRFRTTLG